MPSFSVRELAQPTEGDSVRSRLWSLILNELPFPFRQIGMEIAQLLGWLDQTSTRVWVGLHRSPGWYCVTVAGCVTLMLTALLFFPFIVSHDPTLGELANEGASMCVSPVQPSRDRATGRRKIAGASRICLSIIGLRASCLSRNSTAGWLKSVLRSMSHKESEINQPVVRQIGTERSGRLLYVWPPFNWDLSKRLPKRFDVSRMFDWNWTPLRSRLNRGGWSMGRSFENPVQTSMRLRERPSIDHGIRGYRFRRNGLLEPIAAKSTNHGVPR